VSTEHVILFAGPMGAGKTTAIASLSDIPMVTTEAVNNDTAAHAKEMTTVAMDYGQITMDDGEVVRLYGVPGQERFDFMWRIFETRAVGLILLLDANAKDPIADLDYFLDKFRELVRRGAVVVGVTQTDVAGSKGVDAYYARLRERRQFMPVYEVDARSRDQMIVVLSSLVVMVQMRDAELGAA
jgi:signal recognition particle receptor subunit beta